MDYIDQLTEFGLTRQEATIYVELIRHGSMTGYEVSKETGISKSNVYAALKGLTSKGAAVCEEREATKYLPVDVKVFCDNHLRYLDEIKDSLICNQPKKVEVADGYITIQTYRNIINKFHEMLASCDKRLYLMAEADVVSMFSNELATLASEGKKIVVLSDKEVDIDNITFYKVESIDKHIRFIVDSDYVLTGSIKGDVDDTCLYSGQETLVNLVKETIKNKMLLADKEI